MDKVLELLRRAMQNARVMAVVSFDPELFVFTSALQVAITKGEEYRAKKKRTASQRKAYLFECQELLLDYKQYLYKGGYYNA